MRVVSPKKSDVNVAKMIESGIKQKSNHEVSFSGKRIVTPQDIAKANRFFLSLK